MPLSEIAADDRPFKSGSKEEEINMALFVNN